MSCPPVEYEDSLLKKTIILSTIMVVALGGNVLVGLVFCKVRSLRSNVNCFFINMALSDVLYPLVAWPRILVTEYQSGQWLIGGALGNFLCPFSFFLQDVSTAVSVLSLVLISVERFIAVVFPLKVRQLTPTLRAWCIASTWITAIVLESPFLYAVKLEENTNSTYCVYDWARADQKKALTIFSLVTFTGCWLIPAFVMLALYTVTAISMRRNNKACSQRYLQRQKQTRKVLILAVVTVVVFFVCWVPFHLFVFLYLLSDLCKSKIEKLRLPALYLGYSSTAVNPIILFTFSQKFRKGLMSVFRRNGQDSMRSTKRTVTSSTRNATVLKSLV